MLSLLTYQKSLFYRELERDWENFSPKNAPTIASEIELSSNKINQRIKIGIAAIS